MRVRVEDLERLDFSDVSDGEAVGAVAPGKVLKLEFMEPAGLSARGLAKAIGVPVNRVTGIINGDRAITADTALLLAGYFGNTARFWLGLQMGHDLEAARARLRRVKEAA